jgi:hypothetical protein
MNHVLIIIKIIKILKLNKNTAIIFFFESNTCMNLLTKKGSSFDSFFFFLRVSYDLEPVWYCDNSCFLEYFLFRNTSKKYFIIIF